MNKTLITIFTLLFCLTSSVGWNKTWDDLVLRNGVYYEKLSDIPFTGEIIKKTTVNEGGSFKNGKREGPWVSYYDNGQLQSKGNYKNGEQNGFWV